ncbi:MAG: dihydrofolate reductase family protein [Candidatus Omnitrophica bacterium]|nr:dihydrofolate reductase family protein [Candidatus Omnitrophota bacterium]
MAKTAFSRPFTVAKTAQTLDGKVATRNGRSKWITSQRTRDFAHRRRDQFDAIIVGANTLIQDDPELNGVRSKKLAKIVVDTTLRVSPRSRIFLSPQLCWLATTRKAKKTTLKQFQNMGVNILLCPSRGGRVSLPYLFDRMKRLGFNKVLIEGGPTLIGTALKERLVDRMHIYIAPKIMGDSKALASVSGLTPLNVSTLSMLERIKIKKIDPDILVEADVYRHR